MWKSEKGNCKYKNLISTYVYLKCLSMDYSHSPMGTLDSLVCNYTLVKYQLHYNYVNFITNSIYRYR